MTETSSWKDSEWLNEVIEGADGVLGGRYMISPISGSQSISAVSHQTEPPPAQSGPKATTLPQDTVSISPQAHAATPSVDVDHDGDSH
jgi:hypothetical protein